MDAHVLAVILWIMMGLAGFAVGLGGLVATRRRMQQPVSRSGAHERRPLGVR